MSDDKFDLSKSTVELYRSGEAVAVKSAPGPPKRIDGHTIGAPLLTRQPPHGGEVHPDGDELLYLLSGRVAVVVEDAEPPRRVELSPGEAFIVPRGIWHQVLLDEPSQILFITPGPGGAHRPPT